jgi:hypothetical protein
MYSSSDMLIGPVVIKKKQCARFVSRDGGRVKGEG